MRTEQEIQPMEIIIPHELYDIWISTDFPSIQENNRAAPESTLNIDMSSCEWVSPLPLLALAAECMTYSSTARHININLGSGGTGQLAENRSRVRRFLSLHGFLDAFASRKDLIVRFQFDQTDEAGNAGHWYDANSELRRLQEDLERSRVDLLYGDTAVLPATTWALPNSDSPDLSITIRKQVDRLLRQVDIALFKFKTEARKYRDVTLQRLNQVLLELVENAAEHAYLDTDGGYVSLYARVRQTESGIASKSRERELMQSPLLSNLLLSEKQHQIEIFVVDVGRGLFSDITTWSDDGIQKTKVHQPLRNTAGMLFIRPLSRHNRTNSSVARLRGSSTGLMHLHSILSHQNDISRIVTGSEWLVGSHPRPLGFHPDSVTAGMYKDSSESIKGTFFHIGISPSEIPELDFNWFASDSALNANSRRLIIKKFASISLPRNLDTRVIDIRANDGLQNVGALVIARASASSSTVIRVNRIAEKNLVNTLIYSWIEGVGKSRQRNPVLYLCDIGRFQAIDIAWVIEKLFNARLWLDLENIPEEALIFLVTEDLCCTQFKVQFKPQTKVKPKASDEGKEIEVTYVLKYRVLVDRPTRDIKNLENRLVSVLNELRICDTQMLWASIARLNEKWPANPVTIKDVRWGAEGSKVLPNYLNFSVLVQDEEAARCVRRSLRRILALFPDANDIALDGLVESSLHDAKKWLIRPEIETDKLVLVGSISVSGSTLKRYRPIHRGTVSGVIDCIKSPYYNVCQSDAHLHLAALLWDPSLPVDTKNTPRYQRIGKLAFVERISNEQTPLNLHYDEKLYGELESANLVKVGHWSYGDRHCLLEINSELAIEQSGASESGPIPWLAKKLTELCEQQLVVLAFPVDKLAYRLAHHVKSRVSNAVRERLVLLPLSFLPRVAGGISKFAPLVFDSAKHLSTMEGQEQPLAVFLDFGFITNRTMRHSVRQLYGAGFAHVQVMGLLNRSSSPSLDYEIVSSALTPIPIPIPQAYWRWNVPTMGTGAHCFLCNALHSLARLRRLVNEAHIDLLSPVEAIGRNWIARDVADFWNEYGLSPIALTDQMKQSIAPMFREVPCDTFPANSSTLSARVIERLRTTGDPEFPQSVAEHLLSTNGNEQAVELITTVLILTNNSFSPPNLHEYVALLVKSAIALGEEPYDSCRAEKISRLLGLVALVFATQDRNCKLAVQEQLCFLLESKDISDIPHLRIALIALTIDSDESEEVQNAFHDRCTANRNKSMLIRNYHAIRPINGTAKDTWDKLTQAFGRSKSHSQQSTLGGLTEKLSNVTEPAGVIPRIEHIANLLGQCDRNFVLDNFEIDLHEVITNVRKLSKDGCAPNASIGSFSSSIKETFNLIATKLHLALKRFGDRAESPKIYNLFFDMLLEQTSSNGMSLGEDIVFTRSAEIMEWHNELGGYLPICGHITKLFSEIFSNIKNKSTKSAPPDMPEFAGLISEALGWILFDTQKESQDKGITIVLVTGSDSQKELLEYRPKVIGLNEWGVCVESKNIKSADRRYFEIRIRIPSLATILEEL